MEQAQSPKKARSFTTAEKRECKSSWPICKTEITRPKKINESIEIWTFRQKRSPKIIHDYLANPHKSQKYSQTIVTQLEKGLPKSLENTSDELIVGRMPHSCNSKQSFIRSSILNISQQSDLLKSFIEADQTLLNSRLRISKMKPVQLSNEDPLQRSQTINFYNQFVSRSESFLEPNQDLCFPLEPEDDQEKQIIR